MSEFVVEKGEKPNDLTVLSDIDKKLATALTYKEQGTDHFKAGNFKKAIATYAKVMAFTRGLPGSNRGLSGMAEMAGKKGVEKISEIDDNRAIDLETVALTNIATCYLKLGEPRKALEFSQKALETNNNAWKASLRKSESHTMMLNFVLARAALEEALAIAPDSGSKAAVKKEKDRMIALERATTISDNQKQKKAFAKMFSENNKDSVSTPSVVPENSGSSSSSSSIDKNLKANSSS